MQILSRDRIVQAVQLDQHAMAAVEAGFAALGRGDVTQPPIMSLDIAEANGEVDIKTAYIKGQAHFAIKISSGFFDNPALGLSSLNGLMIVMSAKTGVVEAVLLDEGYLTDIRTALAGGIAARCLSNEDSHRVTLIGAGLQAELQLAALLLVRSIDKVAVWARDTDKARIFTERLAKKYSLDVVVHEDIKTACQNADIIVTTTPAREPLLTAEDLPEGVHVTAMGSDSPYKRELNTSVLERANRVVVDTRSQSELNGELKAFKGQGLSFDVPELGKILTGQEYGRVRRDEITVCDLTGTGVQDTAIAAYALHALSTSEA